MLNDEHEDPPLAPKGVNSIDPVTIGPFRFIAPYRFTFRCVAKGRWVDRPLVDVFTEEFKHWQRAQILQRMRDADIVVNGHSVDTDYRIREHDVIEHTIIRIESPVYAAPVPQLGECGDFVAFLKPSSVPVHATGGYFYNTLLRMIGVRLYPLHRLDRVTSGIIVMAKTDSAAKAFTGMLREKSVKKAYYARVLGEFPDGVVRVDQPILEAKRDRALRECGAGGKESLTVFKRVATNGRESIVKCMPITGRTHQIRVHLSYLGHPISNDFYYGGNRPKLTEEEEKALKEAEKRGLWPPNTLIEGDDPALLFKIYLHSYHYKTDMFDFRAPKPDWFELEMDKKQK